MLKPFLLYLALCMSCLTASAQSAAAMTRVDPATPSGDAASAPAKHKWVKKFKNRKPGKDAVDPERSPDKKGGQ